MTNTHMDTPKASQKWQRRLLVGSLAVNLLVIGVFVGGAVMGNGPRGPQRFDLTVGPLTRAMDDVHRQALRDDLRSSGAFERADRAGIREDTETLLATLRADEFDETTFREILIRQRVRLQKGQDVLLDAVAGQIGEMSVEDRNAFADRIQNQDRRGAQDQDRRGTPPPPPPSN
ncbi:MAG: periplasmic heavy metal sensor [Octadecabacter sp.]